MFSCQFFSYTVRELLPLTEDLKIRYRYPSFIEKQEDEFENVERTYLLSPS